MEQRSARNRPRTRWLVVWAFAVLWIVVVIARLTYLQLYSYSDYLARAQHQQQRIVELSPKRGIIYDRRGRELAVSIPMDTCVADPPEISDPHMVANLLSRALSLPSDDIEKKLREERTAFPLARKLTPEVAARIEALNLRGIYMQKENHRIYPQRDLAAHVIGYVDIDEHGLGGIEQTFDKRMRGRPGRMLVQADAKRRWYDRSEAPDQPGASVTLTIDETIQYIAQKELDQAIAETHARAGTVVVQDPNSGEMLAVANWPTFDPNDPGKYPDESRMDRAVSAAYEPGSTFKLITLGGAIEDGVAQPTDLIDCQMGSIQLPGRIIHDWKRFGTLTVKQILEHSSDVGAIKVALRLGAPKFYEMIRRFDFGQPTGIELPGENRGLLRPLDDWSANSIGSLAMGQEISVTPVQMVSAVSAIANGGILYRPRVVKAINSNPDGLETVADRRPAPVRVFDPTTAADLRDMMQGVVLEGTGKPAKLDGYSDGGKSGTAQKIDPATGRYSRTNYVASFAGFAPVNEPAIAILVMLDSPVGAHHGGEVAGPVFKRVAGQVLAYLNVPHDLPMPEETQLAAHKPKNPKPDRDAMARQAPEGDSGSLYPAAQAVPAPTVELESNGGVLVPSFVGASVRSVTESCAQLGLTPFLIGSGVAVEQSPAAGSRVPLGGRVTVRFGRIASLVPAAIRMEGH